MNLNNKWLISVDDETWNADVYGVFNTKEEVLRFIEVTEASELHDIYHKKTGIQLEDDNSIELYIGQAKEHNPHIEAGAIVEYLRDQAFEESGNRAYEYLLDVTAEQLKDLDSSFKKLLGDWIETHNLQPNFYNMASVEKIRKPFNAM